jgi:hypothetical protein
MPGATLHAARIVRPLHRVNDRVETRTDQVAQMTAPTVFALHVRSDSCVDDSTLTDKTRFLFLRSVISTLYWRYLATDASHPTVFAANCAVYHKPQLDPVTTMDRSRC